jgi:hypothetical protein
MRRIILILLSCLLIVGVFAYPVFALTQTLNRTGGSPTTSSSSSWQTLSWDWTTYTGYNTITSVQYDYTVSADIAVLASYDYQVVTIGGVNYLGSFRYLTAGTSSSATYTWTTNPATGLAWTISDINSAKFGTYVQVLGGGTTTFTTFSVVVTYVLTVPTVTTSDATLITYSGASHNATLNGAITSEGSATPDLEGFAWSTTSNATAPANIVPPATYTTNWTTASGGVGSFNHNVGGLTKGTTYYYRAYAHNSQGWAWGSEDSFTTLTDPSITTSTTSAITSTTARLNALVTNDGGESCSVRFLLGTASGVYTSNTTLVAGYVTGNTPYVDITGLAIVTTYYVRAEISNSVSTQLGAEVTFTTESGISEPTDLKAIPNATSVSLIWTKGVGSNKTLIRYKAGSYPISKTDGSEAYFDTQSSTVKTGLTAGTTYYVMAWGETSGIYSTSNTTIMFTTLATTAPTSTLATPPSNSMWFQSPDYTNMRYMPFYSVINFAFDSFEMPKSTGWYMLALLLSVTVGIIFYASLGNHNLFLSIIAVGACIVGGALLKLVPLWNIVPFVVIALAGIFVGERR